MKKCLLIIIAAIMAMGMMTPSLAFADNKADDNCVETSILGNGQVCDNEGDSIINVLKLVVDIMSIGIGILGVIGITIVGIQYLTAGGSEEKTRKAKRRLFEIIIGLVAYAIIYGILQWLNVGQ